MIKHPFPPLFDKNSTILILGSFPSVKSRAQNFFYGHPQNRFWKVLSLVFEDALPKTIPEKRSFLFKHNIALWDVIGACDITGSADSTIKNATANDLTEILNSAPIKQIYVNGKTALKYYDKYTKPLLKKEAICLPSTSPANAAFTLEKLVQKWSIIRS